MLKTLVSHWNKDGFNVLRQKKKKMKWRVAAGNRMYDTWLVQPADDL